MSQTIIVALIGLAGNGLVCVAFSLMGRAHAKERRFLVNAALSGNTYEFAVRQEASADRRPPESSDAPIQLPEGL